MRRDNRPNWIRRLARRIEAARARHFLYPQFETIGTGCEIARPQDIQVHGRGITVGNHVHMSATRAQNIWLTSWQWWDSHGHIEIGDYALLTPGVRISSSQRITIGRGTMLASFAYLTDSDWHGTYDRTRESGKSAPIFLGENVWIGDSAIVCKGVTVGDNSIIGAGAIVVNDIPSNVIAAGNPARIVRTLDPEEPRRTRMDYFSDPEKLEADMEMLHHHMQKGRTTPGWIKSIFWPGRED